MPETQVFFYQETDQTVPVKAWLAGLKKQNRRAFARCVAAVTRLGQHGHELRRPHADYLRDGIYELRAREGRVNYRILYFFHGKSIAILAHGLTKEAAVPVADIDRAIRRKAALEAAPTTHIYEEETDDGRET